MHLVLAAWLCPLFMSLGLLDPLVMTLELDNTHSPFNLYLPYGSPECYLVGGGINHCAIPLPDLF